MGNAKSPCESCKRVKDPEMCANKRCPLWRDWWLGRWEQIHNFGEKHIKK